MMPRSCVKELERQFRESPQTVDTIRLKYPPFYSMNSLHRLQLVILSHNRPDCLQRLIDELLLPAADCGAQVTVVDNASGPEVQKFLAQYAEKPNLEIIPLNENLGVAKGRNKGFSCSQRKYIAYLDDDSMMKLEDLASVPQLFDENPDAGILAFRVVHGLTGEPQNEHG